MIDEIEELWKLADECRQWQKGVIHEHPKSADMFRRLAKQLDDIAKRIVAAKHQGEDQ